MNPSIKNREVRDGVGPGCNRLESGGPASCSHTSPLHARGSRRVAEFFSPVISRWRRRNHCPCEEPATMRCSIHRSKLCDDMMCVGMHRWAFGKDGHGSCQFEALMSPLDYAIRSLAVIVVGLAVVLAVMYLGVRL